MPCAATPRDPSSVAAQRDTKETGKTAQVNVDVLINLLLTFSINLLVVYRESVNLIGYLTRILSADSQQLWIANENRSPIYFDQSRSFKF